MFLKVECLSYSSFQTRWILSSVQTDSDLLETALKHPFLLASLPHHIHSCIETHPDMKAKAKNRAFCLIILWRRSLAARISRYFLDPHVSPQVEFFYLQKRRISLNYLSRFVNAVLVSLCACFPFCSVPLQKIYFSLLLSLKNSISFLYRCYQWSTVYSLPG